MVLGADKTRINKYKSGYIIKIEGVSISQKWHLMVVSIDTQLGNINGEKLWMNYINVNHLVWLHDSTILNDK